MLLLRHDRPPKLLQGGLQAIVLDVAEHSRKMLCLVLRQRQSPALRPVHGNHWLLDDLDALDRRKAEEAVDPVDELAKLMAQEKSARAFAGNDQRARLEAAIRLPFAGASLPDDLFRLCAVCEFRPCNIFPGAEQHGVDARPLGEDRIDEAIGDLGDLEERFASHLGLSFPWKAAEGRGIEPVMKLQSPHPYRIGAAAERLA